MCEVFVIWYCFVFFFKQKTAYEMRISDWSSDVCSSDLIRSSIGMPARAPRGTGSSRCTTNASTGCGPSIWRARSRPSATTGTAISRYSRSEEHTSELQSLMRISYAVFCLKKKKKKTQQRAHNNNKTLTQTKTKDTNTSTK